MKKYWMVPLRWDKKTKDVCLCHFYLALCRWSDIHGKPHTIDWKTNRTNKQVQWGYTVQKHVLQNQLHF